MSAIVPVMVKKAYHDDPFFENSKVVYSLYDDEFTTPMSDRLNEKILMSGIELSDVTAVAGNANYETLSKLAMQYSDGVIQASEKVNANLLEDIKNSQKLFLPYVSEENYVTSYNEFYDKVLEK
jgi:starch synthase